MSGASQTLHTTGVDFTDLVKAIWLNVTSVGNNQPLQLGFDDGQSATDVPFASFALALGGIGAWTGFLPLREGDAIELKTNNVAPVTGVYLIVGAHLFGDAGFGP